MAHSSDDLLTARQVQDRLKVDRITVYRMLKDGRLKGVKIGQQWRFPAGEVDRLCSGAPSPAAQAEGRPRGFPTHCVQTIQNLFSGISELGAVVVDNDGQLLTQYTPSGPYASLLSGGPGANELLKQAWQQCSAAGIPAAVQGGLVFAAAPFFDGNCRAGWFLCGPAAQGAAQPDSEARMQSWAGQAASAIQAILSERSAYLQRLDSIARISSLDS